MPSLCALFGVFGSFWVCYIWATFLMMLGLRKFGVGVLRLLLLFVFGTWCLFVVDGFVGCRVAFGVCVV